MLNSTRCSALHHANGIRRSHTPCSPTDPPPARHRSAEPASAFHRAIAQLGGQAALQEGKLEQALRQQGVPYHSNCELTVWKQSIKVRPRINSPPVVLATVLAVGCRGLAGWLAPQPGAPAGARRRLGKLLPPSRAQGPWKGRKQGRGEEEPDADAVPKPDAHYLIIRSGRTKASDYRWVAG
jgi:hypothetical protein